MFILEKKPTTMLNHFRVFVGIHTQEFGSFLACELLLENIGPH
jgi:hypothetical protein